LRDISFATIIAVLLNPILQSELVSNKMCVVLFGKLWYSRDLELAHSVLSVKRNEFVCWDLTELN
jgi:hypothetical protein